MKIARAGHAAALRQLLGRWPVVAVLGPRQVGKTTLARDVAAAYRPATVFDLEDAGDAARLTDPLLALRDRRGLVVLDEIQRRPDLFPALRVLADRPRRPARFLVLGSASPALLRQTSESLAGRIHFYDLPGLSMEEVGPQRVNRLWLRGGFPRAFAARSDGESFEWRRDFLRTFLERDLPQLGITIPAGTLGRFWSMLAHYHGQIWNSAEFARAFGVADMTVRRYLDVLRQTLVVRALQPWHENLSKRQVKSPKIYLADQGMLHALLDLRSMDDLERHPKVGASWEGFALATIVQHLKADADECFFWATHAGAELDLLVVRGRTRLGFECKRTTAPAVTPSMRIAMDDLRLTRLDVIHAGDHTIPLAPRIRAVPLTRVLQEVTHLPR